MARDEGMDGVVPSVLGGTWSRFVELWCDGHPPAYEQSVASASLRTVGELWPEAISTGFRGMYSACGLIELGRSLSLVRNGSGFDSLLHRLKLRNQGAHAELIVASSLMGRGLAVRIGASCENRVIDAAIEDDSGTIYVEVTSPNESEVLAAQRKLTMELGIQLNAATEGFSVSIEFIDDPTPKLVETLVRRVLADASGVWQEIGRSARFCRCRSLPESRELTIQWPGIDRRAEKIVRRKCEQFARSVPNILVIDMTSIGVSVPAWLNSIRKLFQPRMNRRIGAVALFQSLFSAHLDRGYRLWWMVENPYALCKVPKKIVDAFLTLDDSAVIRGHESSI